jgi:hypothetical protein
MPLASLSEASGVRILARPEISFLQNICRTFRRMRPSAVDAGSTAATAGISNGALVTPEPGSLLFLGSGLPSFGGLLRRRILGA